MLKAYLSVLIDWRLDCCACIFSMVVASDCGLYRCNYLAVSLGHKYRRPTLMALVQVEMTGNKRVT